jgi:hypothetical protein
LPFCSLHLHLCLLYFTFIIFVLNVFCYYLIGNIDCILRFCCITDVFEGCNSLFPCLFLTLNCVYRFLFIFRRYICFTVCLLIFLFLGFGPMSGCKFWLDDLFSSLYFIFCFLFLPLDSAFAILIGMSWVEYPSSTLLLGCQLS